MRRQWFSFGRQGGVRGAPGSSRRHQHRAQGPRPPRRLPMGRAALGRGSPPGCDQGDPGVPTPPPHQHPGPLRAGDHTRSAAHPPHRPCSVGELPVASSSRTARLGQPTPDQQGARRLAGDSPLEHARPPPTRYSQQGQAPSTPSRRRADEVHRALPARLPTEQPSEQASQHTHATRPPHRVTACCRGV